MKTKLLDTCNEDDLNYIDICIIGTGVAGLAISNEFLNTKFRVLVLESGLNSFKQEIQDLYKSEVVGLNFDGIHNGRFRTMGGSTTKWGGQALPLTPIDFEVRSFVEKSGWPIHFKEVSAYYPKALKFLNVEQGDFREDDFEKLKIKDPGFNKSLIDFHLSKWSPNPNLKLIYKPLIEQSDNIRIIQDANLITLKRSENDEDIKEIEVSNYEKTVVKNISAKIFILCAGGIENARILLNNALAIYKKDKKPDNVIVGKYFQDHPGIQIGELIPLNEKELQKTFNTHFYKNKKNSIRFSLNQNYQKINNLLNVSGSVMFWPNENSFLGNLSKVKNSIQNKSVKDFVVNLFNTIFKINELFISIYYYLFKRRIVKPNSKYILNLSLEQEPDINSCITLSGEKDRFGLSKTKLHWDISYLTWKTTIEFSKIIKNEFERLGLGKVILSSEINYENKNWKQIFGDQNHHIGSTRMGESEISSVVNSNCRLWQTKNLYVAGSSIFTTSGHSNPSLTIIALAIRLSDYIKNNNEKTD